MNLLLDTHIFLWWDIAPSKLSKVAVGALERTTNDLVLSVISIWEIQIGKMSLPSPLAEKLNQI